jgi:hypothetical protein
MLASRDNDYCQYAYCHGHIFMAMKKLNAVSCFLLLLSKIYMHSLFKQAIIICMTQTMTTLPHDELILLAKYCRVVSFYTNIVSKIPSTQSLTKLVSINYHTMAMYDSTWTSYSNLPGLFLDVLLYWPIMKHRNHPFRMITISGHEDVYIQLHILCKHIATFINVYTPLLSSTAIDIITSFTRQ